MENECISKDYNEHAWAPAYRVFWSENKNIFKFVLFSFPASTSGALYWKEHRKHDITIDSSIRQEKQGWESSTEHQLDWTSELKNVLHSKWNMFNGFNCLLIGSRSLTSSACRMSLYTILIWYFHLDENIQICWFIDASRMLSNQLAWIYLPLPYSFAVCNLNSTTKTFIDQIFSLAFWMLTMKFSIVMCVQGIWWIHFEWTSLCVFNEFSHSLNILFSIKGNNQIMI